MTKWNRSKPPRFARFAHAQYVRCLPISPILFLPFFPSFFFVCVCVSGVYILHFSVHLFDLHMMWHVFVLIIVQCKMYGVIIKTFIIIIFTTSWAVSTLSAFNCTCCTSSSLHTFLPQFTYPWVVHQWQPASQPNLQSFFSNKLAVLHAAASVSDLVWLWGKIASA